MTVGGISGLGVGLGFQISADEGIAWGTASNTIVKTTAGSLGASRVLFNTFIANAPQLGLSFIYLFVNNLMTIQASSDEWNSFGKKRRPLRVTKPEGQQRSTHFLQLPYVYAVPLLTLSGVMHWLLSQSMFIRYLDILDDQGRPIQGESINAVGFSVHSVLVFAIVLVISLAFSAAFSYRSTKPATPYGANCSLVLSAACHPPADDLDAQLGLLQWGAIDESDHCSLTSKPVAAPEHGKTYS